MLAKSKMYEWQSRFAGWSLLGSRNTWCVQQASSWSATLSALIKACFIPFTECSLWRPEGGSSEKRLKSLKTSADKYLIKQISWLFFFFAFSMEWMSKGSWQKHQTGAQLRHFTHYFLWNVWRFHTIQKTNEKTFFHPNWWMHISNIGTWVCHYDSIWSNQMSSLALGAHHILTVSSRKIQ